jgi:short-chain fatty acids transporter
MREQRLKRFSEVAGRIVPDAITASIVLLLLLAGGAIAWGNSLAATLDAYYRGLWMLLPFTMQMTLIIVLSSTLSTAPAVRRLVIWLSRLPRSSFQVTSLAALLGAVTSYLYWGLGMALSPIAGVYFAREAERKGIKVDFPFLLAVIWGANAAWQYGFSASAPLLVATPGHFLEKTIGLIPLSTTIGSPAAILHEVLFLAAIIAAGHWLMPKACREISQFPDSSRLADAAQEMKPASLTPSERWERNSLLMLVLCAVFAAWLYYHFGVKRLALDINSLNTTLFLLCFILHRNVKNFTVALQKAVSSAWPVIVLYHLYAGVAGVIQFTTLGERMAGVTAAISTPLTYPLLTAAIGSIFSFFIPSSGGQWAIQGFVTVKSAMEVGVSVQRGILALGIGDHMGNLMSPFWYVVVAGIVRIDFRTFFGYGLVFAAIWFAVGVLVFTFAPC